MSNLQSKYVCRRERRPVWYHPWSCSYICSQIVGDPNYRPTDCLDIIASMPVISPSALAEKPLAALINFVLKFSQCPLIKSANWISLVLLSLCKHQFRSCIMIGESLMWPSWELREVIGLSTGEGLQALRMVHSLVNISGRSLMSDVADDNLLPLEDRYREEDRKRFYHKSFIEYLLDPPYSLQ